MRRRQLMVGALAVSLAACADPDAAAQSEAVTQRQATPVELGASHDVRLVPRQGAELTDDNAGLFALELEAGQVAAVVMRRRHDSALRGYLAAFGPDETKTDRLHGQRELMMAHPDDAVLVVEAARSGTHLIVAADEELDVAADVQIDFVDLDASPGFRLSTYDPAADAYIDELRRLEGELAAYFENGAIWEVGNGHLDVDETDVPLKDKARLRGLVPYANETRDQLFAALSEDRPDAAAALCGALWSALRAERHLLRRP